MKIVNEMKLKFLSCSQNESFSRSAVCSFICPMNPNIEELADIRTAVSEAVTNAVVHAYKNSSGFIEITARILENNQLYIKVKDKGCGIDDVEKAMEPLFTTSSSDDRAGLGFSVMQSFMDKLKVRSKKGQGTVVIMQKKIGAYDE